MANEFKLLLVDSNGVLLEQWILDEAPGDGWLTAGKRAGDDVALHLGREIVHEVNKARGVAVLCQIPG